MEGGQGFKTDRSQEGAQLAMLVGDAAFALDSAKRFVHLNEKFAALINMTLAGLQLQTTEALQDTSLHLSIQDLLARCDAMPGTVHSNNLEINGTLFAIEVLASPNDRGGAEWYFGVLKPSGGSS